MLMACGGDGDTAGETHAHETATAPEPASEAASGHAEERSRSRERPAAPPFRVAGGGVLGAVAQNVEGRVDGPFGLRAEGAARVAAWGDAPGALGVVGGQLTVRVLPGRPGRGTPALVTPAARIDIPSSVRASVRVDGGRVAVHVAAGFALVSTGDANELRLTPGKAVWIDGEGARIVDATSLEGAFASDGPAARPALAPALSAYRAAHEAYAAASARIRSAEDDEARAAATRDALTEGRALYAKRGALLLARDLARAASVAELEGAESAEALASASALLAAPIRRAGAGAIDR